MGREHSKFEFRYDQNDQLIQTRFQGMNGMPNLNRSHQYDFVGNRIRDSHGNTLSEFVSNFLTRNGQSSFTADPDGLGQVVQEITGDKVKNTTYRADGRLASFQSGSQSVAYFYDGLGRLVSKSINDGGTQKVESVVHLGTQSRVLLGKAKDGTVTTYIDGKGAAERLGEVKGSIGKGYITDHLGSVLNSAPAGSSRAYGVFGQVNANIPLTDSASPVMYAWQGLRYDPVTG